MANKSYNIGHFDHPVQFLRPERTISESGERELHYVDAGSRYCEVQDAKLAADETQDALTEEQTFVLKTWHAREASTDWRVRFDGQDYAIIRVERLRYGITFYYIRRIDLCNE